MVSVPVFSDSFAPTDPLNDSQAGTIPAIDASLPYPPDILPDVTVVSSVSLPRASLRDISSPMR